MARHELGYAGADPNALSGFREMKLGTRTTLALTFHLANRIDFAGTITDNRFSDKSQRVSLASLPEELSTALQAALEQARTRLKAARAAQAAGDAAGTPPP
jgi:hypothetical protein